MAWSMRDRKIIIDRWAAEERAAREERITKALETIARNSNAQQDSETGKVHGSGSA